MAFPLNIDPEIFDQWQFERTMGGWFNPLTSEADKEFEKLYMTPKPPTESELEDMERCFQSQEKQNPATAQRGFQFLE